MIERTPESEPWDAVMARSTYAPSSVLQWFLPIRVAPEPVIEEPLGSWVLQPVRKRDLRAYVQSLAEVVETTAPGEESDADELGWGNHASRIRIYRFEPGVDWKDSVEDYDDGFRRLFQISGSKVDPEPEIVRLGVFEFESGDVTSHYLGVTMRYPLGRSSPDKPSWSVGDLIQLNHQLVGPERGALPDESPDSMYGTVSPTDDWIVARGADSPDGAATMVWREFLRGLLACSAVVDGRTVGPFGFDVGERPTCMTAVVIDEELARPEAIRVAEHVGSSMRSTTRPNHPLGVHSDDSLPESLFERSDRLCYVVTQRAAGLVVYPDGSNDEYNDYLRRQLPKEFQVQNPTLYLLALHQKRALDRILDGLSGIELITSAEDVAAARDLPHLREQLAQVRAIQLSFHQLQSWTRYRLVSPRFGAQGFYDLVYRQYRLDESYADVDRILSGLEGYVQVQFSEYERAFESRIQRWGLAFAIVTLLLATLSINIRGFTANNEGVTWGFLGVTAVITVLLGVGFAGGVTLRRVRRRGSAERPPPHSA